MHRMACAYNTIASRRRVLEGDELARVNMVVCCVVCRPLLAGLAVGVIDRAELDVAGRLTAGCRQRGRRCSGGRGSTRTCSGHAGANAAELRHRIHLAAAHRGLLGVGGAGGAQVVGGLDATQPRKPVDLVEFLARGTGHVDVE